MSCLKKVSVHATDLCGIPYSYVMTTFATEMRAWISYSKVTMTFVLISVFMVSYQLFLIIFPYFNYNKVRVHYA